MKILNRLYIGLIRLRNFVVHRTQSLYTNLLFYLNDVSYGSFRTNGIPYIKNRGKITIGENFKMNNGFEANVIGIKAPCVFRVEKGAHLHIGDNVGLSQCALIAYSDINIANNVKIGGGVVVYTSDFHTLDYKIRNSDQDQKHRIDKPVKIGRDVFIGAQSIILKGVTIGDRSIVGAGSVVTKSIPPDELWAGNPAKFIRKL